MTEDQLISKLNFFFPETFPLPFNPQENPKVKLILETLINMADEPIQLTRFNQLLHRVGEAGVSNGFFRYYFLSKPENHPFPIEKVLDGMPGLNERGVSTLDQLDWGFKRFFIDSLLYFGDLRIAFNKLKNLSYEKLETFFSSKRFDSTTMR